MTSDKEIIGARAGLKRAMEYTASNIAGNLSVQVLAKIAGVTPHHFSAMFKRKIGFPPHRFILGEPIERAKAYLDDETLSIRQVSELTGFRTQEHFTKVFRKLTDSTPTQFRAHTVRR